ncbi:RT0821/Lpp0805 family surface protein [Malonomonas rubra]|uniref:RT0821/Lpp0805 family surface protein n=1 Tax=Malonomonas rubra TaxID=57040 RepID=UPI0026E9A065|nr:RT0821/Lpp0805 family surface protein [Malonomonas rubra]
MRYLIVFLVLLTATTALANHRSTLYQLTQGDADSLVGGFQYALAKSPDNQAVDWSNWATGLSGSIVPFRSYQTSYGQICREYLSTVQLDGSIQQAFGTACQQGDGGWNIAGEKMVKRSQAIKFVYLKQSPRQVVQSCPFNSSPKMNRGGSFHSDRFHEEFRKYHKNFRTTPEPRQIEQQQPSKLIKLVTY